MNKEVWSKIRQAQIKEQVRKQVKRQLSDRIAVLFSHTLPAVGLIIRNQAHDANE